MSSALTATDASAPLPASAAFGILRSRTMAALILGRPAPVPRKSLADLTAWAEEIVARAQGPAQGLTAATVPAAWFEVLVWAGVPMSPAGPLAWGADLAEDGGVGHPTLRDTRMLLPPSATLARLTSLDLKPLRAFIAQRLGCRLQAAAGLHLYLWPNQALVISCADLPLGGFLHGPNPAQRSPLALDPGGFEIVRW